MSIFNRLRAFVKLVAVCCWCASDGALSCRPGAGALRRRLRVAHLSLLPGLARVPPVVDHLGCGACVVDGASVVVLCDRNPVKVGLASVR